MRLQNGGKEGGEIDFEEGYWEVVLGVFVFSEGRCAFECARLCPFLPRVLLLTLVQVLLQPSSFCLLCLCRVPAGVVGCVAAGEVELSVVIDQPLPQILLLYFLVHLQMVVPVADAIVLYLLVVCVSAVMVNADFAVIAADVRLLRAYFGPIIVGGSLLLAMLVMAVILQVQLFLGLVQLLF